MVKRRRYSNFEKSQLRSQRRERMDRRTVELEENAVRRVAKRDRQRSAQQSGATQ
jgi:hypothetical protein